MERPDNCPEQLYTMMCRCWQHRPSARPTFIQIVSILLDEASPQFRDVSFYHSPSGQELLQLPQREYSRLIQDASPVRYLDKYELLILLQINYWKSLMYEHHYEPKKRTSVLAQMMTLTMMMITMIQTILKVTSWTIEIFMLWQVQADHRTRP